MAYNLMLTLKSNEQINSQADALALETHRNRSQYVRDVIKILAKREDLKNRIKQAIGLPAIINEK